MNITRSIQSEIEESAFKQKVIIIYGARRTGKTTLVKEILNKYKTGGRYINCESLVNKQALETNNIDQLKAFLGDYRLVVLDEAQNIEKIGYVLKLLIDTFPEIQIIATGSNSFDLANQTGEPLVGRSRNFILYPLSLSEIKNWQDLFFVEAKLESILRFGSMPSVFNLTEEESKEELNQITTSYLYKDILAFEGIKKSKPIQNLLIALALQLGNEVSFRELGQIIGINHATVARYIDILEKSYIVFTLNSLSRNPRNEIKHGKKIYFYDLGIRNSLIQNYNNLNMRSDTGGLWENFCILERMKKAQSEKLFFNPYFWRTTTQKEVDYIEEHSGILHAFEFKWADKKKVKPPTLFLESYQNSLFSLVNNKNYIEYLL
jgi:uncharacterized protein